MLYNHPDQFVFVVTRYFVYLVQYSHLFKIDPNDLLDSIFEPNTIYMNMESEMMSDNSSKITKYTVIVRSFIPKIFTDPKEDKFAITNLTVDVERREYKISQICYDTNDATKFATAKILYDKSFYLQSDGTLYNPNYILSKELFDDDLDYYRLMISQIMIFLGGLLEASTELFTIKVNPKDKHVL